MNFASKKVVRFTGRTRAESVVQLAKELAERSDIPDMGDIPVGYLVKIPYSELTPEHLPVTHPRRKEAEADRVAREEALAEAPVPVTRGGLEGVLVIIDPGHGGRDTGTIKHGLTEHEYVYDVACRLRKLLLESTSARVERPGAHPDIRLVGGAEYTTTVEKDNWRLPAGVHLETVRRDAWVGWGFRLREGDATGRRRVRLIPALRARRTDFVDPPRQFASSEKNSRLTIPT